MRNLSTSLAAVAVLWSCGDAADLPATTPTTVMDPAPQTGAWTRESARPLGASAQALGVDGEAHVVVIAEGLAYVAVGGQLDKRTLYAGPGEPTSMGQPRAVRARPGAGAWIATSSGLYALDPHFVTRSPLSERTPDVNDVAEAAAGPLAGIWILDAAGLWTKNPAGLQQVHVDLPEARWIAVDTLGQFALLASEQSLQLLTKQGDALSALEIRLDTGLIRGLAAAPGRLWVATERGLFETDGQSWTHHPLQGQSIEAVATDPATGAAWARSPQALWQVQGTTHTRYGSGLDEVGLSVDGLGDVFGLASGALFKRGTGAPRGEAVTFSDVQPWLTTHCAQCHQNQTADFLVYDAFVERAEEALARVRSGDMPRCQGSVRCPTDAALAPADYSVLEQWIRDGMPQ